MAKRVQVCDLYNKWSSSVDRTTKEEFVVSLRAALNTASLVVVAQQKGMTVAQVSDLRRKMRSEGASYKVAKKTP
jgi:large subunit ribosomal protein L10